jgi:hypothetical protein
MTNYKRLMLTLHDYFAGAWVEIASPADIGMAGGLPLSRFAENSTVFSPTSEAFVLSVLHQYHCVVSIIALSISTYKFFFLPNTQNVYSNILAGRLGNS